MFKPIILKQKINYQNWKRILILSDYKKLKDFVYIPSDRISEFIYQQNIKHVIDLLNNQHKNQFNQEAVYRYIGALNNLLERNRLTQSEKSKVESTIKLLTEFIETAFVGDFYYPQITTDETYNRLYYHPIYRFQEKIVINLFTKFGLVDFDRCSVIKVDINGALVRTITNTLFKITRNQIYKHLTETQNDIYDEILKLSPKPHIDRNVLKQNIITFINKGTVKNITQILPEYLVSDIETFIHPNLPIVRKYMTIYSNKKLQQFQELVNNFNSSTSFFLYVNLDGGILITNKPNTNIPENNLPISYLHLDKSP